MISLVNRAIPILIIVFSFRLKIKIVKLNKIINENNIFYTSSRLNTRNMSRIMKETK